MKGNSLQRGRSNTPPKNYDDKRSKTSRIEENSTDVYYNRTVEDRLNKQAEQNTFLAKSLAGLSAEVRNLSSHPPQALLQPVGNLAQSWAQTVTSQTPKQTTVNYGLPPNQNTTPFQIPSLMHQNTYRPFQ